MTLSFLCWLTLEVPEKASVANSVLAYLFYSFFFFLFSLYYQDHLSTLSFSVLASKESM
jgi:positive regulator of sigma E activity